MKTKYWCRTCAAYGPSPCPNVGHVSEKMTLDKAASLANGAQKWTRYAKRKLFVAVPPASGRGALEYVPCNDIGEPLSRSS